MTSGGSAYGGRTAPVSVVESNSVVESKATLGLPSTVVSPSLSSEGAYGTAGVRIWCSDALRNALRER